MYDLTKVYKTKAMALNAIRITATNKGWKVLNTEEASEHVWPAVGQEGFTVNNTTLNLALGFITETEAETKLPQRVPEGAITDGATLEAVNAALAENAKVDTKAPKLQAPSKLEQDKKAVKAAKKQEKESKEPTRCTVVNGARRPLRGKTLQVWETTEDLCAKLTRTPTVKEVYEALCAKAPGFNKTTCNIQYYSCLAYNGWQGTKGSK